MDVKVLKNKPFSFDGCKIIDAKPGEIVPVPVSHTHVALELIDKGYIEEYKPKKEKQKVPQNKNTPSARD